MAIKFSPKSLCDNLHQRGSMQGRMAEWSKALRSGRSIFGCVGSNPTPVILFLGTKCFYNNEDCLDRYQSSFLNRTSWINCIKGGLSTEGWPSGLRRCVKAAVSSDEWVRIQLLSLFSSEPSVFTTLKTLWINTNQVFSLEFPT